MIPDLTLYFPDLTCNPGQNSAFTSETPPKPNKAAPRHSSPSRLQNERPHAEQIAKNAWQAKCSKSERGAQRWHRRAAWDSERQASLRDRRVSNPRARSRATQTSTDVETSKTDKPTALPSTASSGMLRRDGGLRVFLVRFKMCRVDGVLVG